MTVKQISVFLENRAGQLCKLTRVLSDHKIDMRALSIADTKDFGVLRRIVDDPDATVEVLRAEGYVVSLTPVLAVEIPDRPGGLDCVLEALARRGVSLEYAYAFITRQTDSAYMIFRVTHTEDAIQALQEAGIHLSCQDKLNQL